MDDVGGEVRPPAGPLGGGPVAHPRQADRDHRAQSDEDAPAAASASEAQDHAEGGEGGGRPDQHRQSEPRVESDVAQRFGPQRLAPGAAHHRRLGRQSGQGRHQGQSGRGRKQAPGRTCGGKTVRRNAKQVEQGQAEQQHGAAILDEPQTDDRRFHAYSPLQTFP